MAEDLRHRYAQLVTDWFEAGTRAARLAELLAVRDEELEHQRKVEARQREEILRYRMNAEKDVCVGCMEREHQRDTWAEASRQNGIKYEAAKQRWYEQAERAEKAEQEVERLQVVETASIGAHALLDDAEEALARVRQLAERWRHVSDRKSGPLRELLAALDDTAGT